nr:MAG TPA: hypothetical protein [Caudoviricetes sp.]
MALRRIRVVNTFYKLNAVSFKCACGWVGILKLYT